MTKYVILVNKDDSLIGKVSSEIYSSLEDALIFIVSRGPHVVMGFNQLNWYDRITGTHYKILPVDEARINHNNIYYGVVATYCRCQVNNNLQTNIIVKTSMMKPEEEKHETLTTTTTIKYFDSLIKAEEYENMLYRG